MLYIGMVTQKFSISFLLLAYIFSIPVNAAEEDSLDALMKLDLEQLLNYEVVSPTRSTSRLSDVPGTVSLITYEQIQNSAARTIPELLRLIPGVHVRWNPMVQTIDIRGFGSNPFTSRVLLLIDGVPYNSWNKGGFPQHPGFDFFNIENIKHLEVIRGTGSALYGENAFNGIINIVSLSGNEYKQTRLNLTAGERHTRSANLTHGGEFGEEGSIFISVKGEHGQLPSRLWREADARFEGQELFVKAQYKGFLFSFFRREDRFDGFDIALIPALNARFTSANKIRQNIDITTLKYTKESDDSSWQLKTNLSYAKRTGSHCGSCHAVSQSNAFERDIDHGYKILGDIQLSLNVADNHSILMGAETQKVSSGQSLTQITTPETPDTIISKYAKHAVFIQDQISFPEQNLTATLGLRYDSETSPFLLKDNISPRVAFVATPHPKWTLRGSWNTAARYPTFVEFYQNSRFIAAETPQSIIFQTDFSPNPNLVAEKVSSFEFGTELQVSDSLLLKADAYRNRITNPIVMVFNDQKFIVENHPADAIIRGLESEIRYSSNGRWSGFFNWSFQSNSQVGDGLDSAGNPIEFTYAPSQKLNAGLTYTSGSGFASTLEWSYRSEHLAPIFWSELAFGSGGAVEIDDFSYLNFKLKYRLPLDIGTNSNPIVVSFVAKNIGNETPTETLNGGDGHLAELPGREFMINLSYEWAN